MYVLWNNSHNKNEIMQFEKTWMDLRTLKQSEASQKQKNKYSTMECRKVIQMNLPAKQKYRHRHREWMHGYRGERGGMN